MAGEKSTVTGRIIAGAVLVLGTLITAPTQAQSPAQAAQARLDELIKAAKA